VTSTLKIVKMETEGRRREAEGDGEIRRETKGRRREAEGDGGIRRGRKTEGDGGRRRGDGGKRRETEGYEESRREDLQMLSVSRIFSSTLALNSQTESIKGSKILKSG
jgi:hypothetical protein